MLYFGHMKIHHYTAIFQKEPEGGYTVVIPALKGCVSYGETIEEAAIAAKEAIESYLGSLAKDLPFMSLRGVLRLGGRATKQSNK